METKHHVQKINDNVSNSLFLKIFDGMTGGFAYCELIIDKLGMPADYRFLMVNTAFEKQSNRSIGSTVGKTIKEILPDIKQSWIDKLGSVVLNNKPIQFTEFNDITKRYFHVNAFSQGENTFVLVIDDITVERKAIEELTFQNDEKEKRAAELVIANKELAFQNDEKEKREAELVIANKELAFQNDEKEKRAAELVIANKELVFQNEEKEKRAIELAIANKELEFQNNEKEKRALELVNAKEKAEQSDWLKTAFLANMSHEIRTPMNGILGFSNLLKRPNLTGEEQQRYIRIIEKSGHRMLNTINDIISISKIESGLMEVDVSESNINEQIEYIYTFFKPEVEGKGLQFFINNPLPYNQALIKSDREKIFAILTNLVKNAIKFTEKGSIEIGYIQKDECLEIYVKDTGIGVDTTKQVAIFERFIQADISNSRAYEGSGLGLSISKAFVEMLGGKLMIKSEMGKGSIFYFTIPHITNIKEKIRKLIGVHIDNMANVNAIETIENQVRNLKILIVENDEISDLLLSIRLEKISREILHASNGLEAIEICRNNPDIDLILMDIKMPVMDGHQATQEIRKFNKDLIIIAQTAHAFEGDKEKAIDAGCNECVSKPIVIKELMALIQHYFH